MIPVEVQTILNEFSLEELAELHDELTKRITIKDPNDPRVRSLQLNVMSIDGQVRITFGEKVAWIQMSASQAFQFACLVLEHAGAKIDKTVIPSGPPV